MRVLFAVALMGIFVSTAADAGMRCKKDWTGATVCTMSDGTTIKCKKDWTGAVVCS